MRNTLILLSSVALASVASAQSFSTATATTRVRYDAPRYAGEPESPLYPATAVRVAAAKSSSAYVRSHSA